MSIRLRVAGAVLAVLLMQGGPALAGVAWPDLRLKLAFHIMPVSGGGMKAVFPAELLVRKGQISGNIIVKDSSGKFPCAVQSGSTDIGYNLNMTCSVENGVDIVTFLGKLNLLTGKGAGTVSDTFLGEKGTYIASKVTKK